jgi:hypothetical protein
MTFFVQLIYHSSDGVTWYPDIMTPLVETILTFELKVHVLILLQIIVMDHLFSCCVQRKWSTTLLKLMFFGITQDNLL